MRCARARLSPLASHVGDSCILERRCPAPPSPISHSRNGEEPDCACPLDPQLRRREVGRMSLRAGRELQLHVRQSRPRSSAGYSRKALYAQRSTIFPNVALDFISSCAARISAKEKTRSTTGLSSPASNNGTTRSEKSRASAIFSYGSLLRSIVPTTVSRF